MPQARESLGVNCYGSMFAENSIGQLDAPTRPLRDKRQALRKSRGRHAAGRDRDGTTDKEQARLASQSHPQDEHYRGFLFNQKVRHSRCLKPCPANTADPDPRMGQLPRSKRDGTMICSHGQLPDHRAQAGALNSRFL